MSNSLLEGERPQARAPLFAAALVAPMIGAPTVAIGAMLWARFDFIAQHAERAAKQPPTISRAIADQSIGHVFALWMLVVAALQLFSVCRISHALLRLTLAADDPRHRKQLGALLTGAFATQLVAIAGVIVLSQYTGLKYNTLHMLGSYMLFYGNGLSILFCGVFCWIEHGQHSARAGDPPLPYDYYLQTRLAVVVTVLSLVFAYLFYDFRRLQEWSDYGYRLTFAMCELALLTACLVYLASFVLSMYRYERYMLVRRFSGESRIGIAHEA